MSRTALERVAVVVVNYGSSSLIDENLTPLSAAAPTVDVVLVDNFSSTAERDAVRRLATHRGWALEEQGNGGFGHGMNTGVAVARRRGADVVVLLNPDARLDVDSLGLLVDAVREAPLTMAAPVVHRPDGSMWSAGSDLYLADGRIRSRRRRVPGAEVVEWLSGACLAVSAELWEAVGGFDPGYFLYWEDVDLSFRVLEAGGRLAVLPDAVAVHAEGGTQSGESHTSAGLPKSSLYYYYNIRNRLLFGSQHLSDEHLHAWRHVSVRVAWEILLQGGRRQLLRSPRPLLAAARGVRDGLRLSSRR